MGREADASQLPPKHMTSILLGLYSAKCDQILYAAFHQMESCLK